MRFTAEDESKALLWWTAAMEGRAGGKRCTRRMALVRQMFEDMNIVRLQDGGAEDRTHRRAGQSWDDSGAEAPAEGG